MQSTINAKLAHLHDVLVVASDVAPVAPSDPTPSSPPTAAPAPEIQPKSELSAAPIPPVDASFRATATDPAASARPSALRRWVSRLLAGVVMAVSLGAAAVAWESHGEEAKQLVAQWTPRLIATLMPSANRVSAGQSGPAAADASAATPTEAPPQPAAALPAQTAGEAPASAAPVTPDSAQLLQSMAGDVTSLRQEIGQLKASIEQLKVGQEQMAREVAKASDPKPRPRIAAPTARAAPAMPSRPMAVAPPRPPVASYRPAAASLPPPPPPSAAPYRARDYEAEAQPPLDPELSSAPRPPMPVR
jgi:hypothetical protein